jgi:hypothetical protein
MSRIWELDVGYIPFLFFGYLDYFQVMFVMI